MHFIIMGFLAPGNKKLPKRNKKAVVFYSERLDDIILKDKRLVIADGERQAG